jgi:hypothetical protein
MKIMNLSYSMGNYSMAGLYDRNRSNARGGNDLI